MELVEVASPTNSHVFPDYILPKIQHFALSENPLIRATYASCLASLANSASRFLDMTQALRADGVLPTTDPEAETGTDTASAQALYDASRDTIIHYFQEHAKLLLTDRDSSVRRAFLKSVSRLCVFFGRNRANDIILSHLNTYLNDKDWMLRSAFFETITGIATYLGSVALEEYIMPLMVQSLTDPEEFVVEKVLRSLAGMAELGLFQRNKIWELVDIVGRFTMHPNIWIREGAAGFIAASTKWVAPADVHCIIYPLVEPFLQSKVVDLSALSLLENLKKPVRSDCPSLFLVILSFPFQLSRNVFDMAVTWAMQQRDGLFWANAQGQRTFIFGSVNESVPRISARGVQASGGTKIAKTKEDEIWLSKLKNLGMSADDEWKIMALREYIWRMAQSRPRLLSDNSQLLNSSISLQSLKITPRTVFFDDSETFFKLPVSQPTLDNSAKSITIADALMDASKTIDRPLKKSPSGQRIVSRPQSRAENGVSLPISGSNTSINHGQSGINPSTSAVTKPLLVPKVSISGSSDSSAPNSVENGNILRHQASKNSLLSRGKGSTKATAETGTISATAFGKVAVSFANDSEVEPSKIIDTDEDQPVYKFRAAHSYDGNDPYILELLDSMYLQNYPSDIVEFGPAIVPVQRRQPIKKSSGRISGGTWKPEGNLVASFGEHTEPINRVVVAPDHNFFLTASDDGTVKIWDSTRLEKNIAFRSRLTYRHGSKVKSLCFVENTRCFVSAAVDGSVHVVKIEFSTTAAKYGKLKVMREYKLAEDNEYAVWAEHFKSENNSILLLATTLSNIYALDLRSMQILYTLKNPIHHGTPTCFCVDRKHTWLVVGTAYGILDMWDLRYHLRLKAWGLPGSTRIHRLQIHPLKGRHKWLIVSGGTARGELTVWDLEKLQCKEIYRVASPNISDSVSSYGPWNIDEEPSETVLHRFAASLNLETPTGFNGGAGGASGVAPIDRGVRAFFAAMDVTEDSSDSRVLPGFILTAGADRKIRFWNTTRVEGSMVVSGMEVDEPKPTYTSSTLSPSGITSYTEMTAVQCDTDSLNSTGTGGIRGFLGVGGSSSGGGGGSSKRKPTKPSGRSSRSTVISQQQQQLLKCHLDSVTDVAFLELPYGMIISVDRSGMVFIYQ
jgi:phosphoinositide-3-kinase regulatory subunit 4